MIHRILIIGAPTIDLIGKKKIVGGPGLYGGLAASFLGCKPYVLGPVGSEELTPILVYRKLGIKYTGPIISGCSFLFKHRYIKEERESSVICKSPSLSFSDFARLRDLNIDIIMINPVYCEISPELVKWIYIQNSTSLLLVDLQGTTRCYGKLWTEFFNSFRSFYHLSTDDLKKIPQLKGVLSYTSGPHEGLVFIDGKKTFELPRPTMLLKDPTGAGDVFFTIFACLYKKNYDLILSLLKSSKLTPLLLSKIKKLVREASKEIP